MAKAKSPKTKKSKSKEAEVDVVQADSLVATPVPAPAAPKRSLLPNLVSRELDSLKERVSTLERLVRSLSDVGVEKK